MLIGSLDLPPNTLVERRVPKTMLLEYAGLTASDRRRIAAGVEQLFWIATLKPETAGISAYRDAVREYSEVCVLTCALRPETDMACLSELVHRAIPYPLLLMSEESEQFGVSTAHKRWSLAEKGAIVLEEAPQIGKLSAKTELRVLHSFLDSLRLSLQTRYDLYALYESWADRIAALRAAELIGEFVQLESTEKRAEHRAALSECLKLRPQMANLQVAAKREKQIARRAEINLELKRLKALWEEALERLRAPKH
jgi:hypothetical protein